MNSPFSWSCGNGHVHVAEYLFKAGANPNTVDKVENIPSHTNTFFFFFSFQLIGLFCQHRNAPLHWTCQNGHLNVVKFLLSIKVNVNAVNMYNYSALDYALDRKNPEVVQLLKKAGAKSGGKVGQPATSQQKKRDFIIK